MTNPKKDSAEKTPKAEGITADPMSQPAESASATTAAEGEPAEGAGEQHFKLDTGATADTAAQREPAKTEEVRRFPLSESLAKTEAESVAVVKNPATRVSLGAIEDHIANVAFMSGHGFAEFANGGKDIRQEIAPSLQSTTICLLTLKNGFSFVGISAPVDPLNYDAELGRKFAYENAVRQVWPVLGYAKRQEIAAR